MPEIDDFISSVWSAPFLYRGIKKYWENLKNKYETVIVEGSGGMKIYSPVYLKKLRKITEKEINIMVETCRKSVDEYVERLKKGKK